MHCFSALAKNLLIIATLLGGCADRTLSEPPPWRCPDTWVEGSILDGQCLVDAGLGGPTHYAYVCSVSEVTGFGTRDETESLLPSCNDGVAPALSTNKPCWAVGPDPQLCTASTASKFWIERSEPIAPDATVISYCEACVRP